VNRSGIADEPAPPVDLSGLSLRPPGQAEIEDSVEEFETTLPEMAPDSDSEPEPELEIASEPELEPELPAMAPEEQLSDPFSAPDFPPLDLPAATPAPSIPSAPAKTFKVVVRLVDGNGVEVGDFKDFGTAMEGAQEVIEQFTNANGSWPFYAGRFIRPDLIVSVDLVAGL
jgi:hypothetical protein